MAVIHISEADAARDFAGLMSKVRAGSEVVIDSTDAHAPSVRIVVDSDYDAWVRSMVQEALDDPRPAVPAEMVEAHFARRRAASLRKIVEAGLDR